MRAVLRTEEVSFNAKYSEKSSLNVSDLVHVMQWVFFHITVPGSWLPICKTGTITGRLGT